MTVKMYCANCGTELAVGQLLGKRKKGRKIYCLRCADIIKGVRDEHGHRIL